MAGILAFAGLWVGAIFALGGHQRGALSAVILASFVVGAILVVALLLRWMFRWRDPQWDTRENQARSELWSTRIGSGGNS